MAMPNPKNLPLSPASADLGLGTDLASQAHEEADAIRKKKMQDQAVSRFAPATSNAAMDLGLTGGL
jgi:hypothetical protein